ncbi:MAG TPA: hypothetical protein VHY22_08400 [Chthoniobacteraceae bacterium]|jgi:hypothetical protein|nr:hypothetical protein [Chthoniobacteraceae bacterium]
MSEPVLESYFLLTKGGENGGRAPSQLIESWKPPSLPPRHGAECGTRLPKELRTTKILHKGEAFISPFLALLLSGQTKFENPFQSSLGSGLRSHALEIEWREGDFPGKEDRIK